MFRNEGEEHLVARDGSLEDLAGERAVQPFCVVHLVSKLELPFNSRDHVELGWREEASGVALYLSTTKCP